MINSKYRILLMSYREMVDRTGCYFFNEQLGGSKA